MSKQLILASLLLITIGLATIPASMAVPSSGVAEERMVFLGEYKELVVGNGVVAYVHKIPSGFSGLGDPYEVVIDYHGRVVRGVTQGMCFGQQVAVSSDGEYTAFINTSSKLVLGYFLSYVNQSTGSHITTASWGYEWSLVLVTGDGERVLATGVMPAIRESVTPHRVKAVWGCPMVAFKGRVLYLLSIDIVSNAPVAEIYTINPDTGEIRRVMGVLNPPPATIFAPLNEDSVFVGFTGYDFGGFVIRPDGAHLMTNLTQYLSSRWYPVDGGALLASSTGEGLYIVKPDLTISEIAGSAKDYATSPDGKHVTLTTVNGLYLYEARGGVLTQVFYGFDPDRVRLSNGLIAYMEEDTITVTTYPPSIEVVAKIDLRGKTFRGPDGISYLLDPEDFFLSDTELSILYKYYDTSGTTNYVLERVALEPRAPLRIREGELTEVRKCTISLNEHPRGATISKGILVISTDEGVMAFRGCEKLWEIRYPYVQIIGAEAGVLYVFNSTTYSKISLSDGEVLEALALPTQIGRYDPSYWGGKLLKDGAVVISALIPGHPFYLLIKGSEYEAVPMKATGFTAITWEERYGLKGQYIITPHGTVTLPEVPERLYVLSERLALASFSYHPTMMVALDRNSSIYITSDVLLSFSPADVGENPGALITTYSGVKYEAILLAYTGDEVVVYREQFQDPIAAAYGEGELAVVVYGEESSILRFYEVVPP